MNDVLLSPLRLSELESLIEKSVVRALQSNSATGGVPAKQQLDFDLLTIKQAAEFLTLRVPTIYSLISRGDLPVMKKNGRCYFSKAELMGYLKSGRKKTRQEISEEAEAYSVKRKRSRQ